MKRCLLPFALLAGLFPISCRESDTQAKATAVACQEITLLTERFEELVTVGVPFLVRQRMIFADRDSEGSVSKMVVVGREEYAGVTVILPFPGSGDSIAGSWTLLRNSRLLFGESSGVDAVPDDWESSFDASGMKIPKINLGILDELKPQCETMVFEPGTKTFSLSTPDRTLGVKAVSLNIEEGEATFGRNLASACAKASNDERTATLNESALASDRAPTSGTSTSSSWTRRPISTEIVSLGSFAWPVPTVPWRRDWLRETPQTSVRSPLPVRDPRPLKPAGLSALVRYDLLV
jgi:hypothetical protein